MDAHEIQQAVYESVKARGYVNGFLPEAFAARQVAKLAEELGEFAECFSGLPPYVDMDLHLSAQTCRGNFDKQSAWHGVTLNNREAAAKELADLCVVMLCAAEALGIDVLSAALAKAEADRVRGVR